MPPGRTGDGRTNSGDRAAATATGTEVSTSAGRILSAIRPIHRAAKDGPHRQSVVRAASESLPVRLFIQIPAASIIAVSPTTLVATPARNR